MTGDSLQERRAERARQGSRRQRDLQAAGMTAPRIAGAHRRSAEQFKRDRAWAEQHLSAEAAGMVVAAIGTLRYAGIPITVDNVRARLVDQGRTAAQLREAA